MTVPRLLALDASTEACSAALQWGDERRERFEVLPRGHAQRLLGMIDELLAEAGASLLDLDGLAFCRGPGAFTGVRIGTGVVQGLALGSGLPVAPVSTLATLAQGLVRERGAERILAAIDARMGELYWGAFRQLDGLAVGLGEELLVPPQAVALPEEPGWIGVGSGWQAHGELLSRRGGATIAASLPDRLPRALDCLTLANAMWSRGELVPVAEVLPVYLRDKVTG